MVPQRRQGADRWPAASRRASSSSSCRPSSSRNWASTYYGPIDGHDLPRWSSHAAGGAPAQGPGPGPRDHGEGQGLPLRRAGRPALPRRRQVRQGRGHQGRAAARADLHRGLRRDARASWRAADPRIHAHHRRHALGHRPRPPARRRCPRRCYDVGIAEGSTPSPSPPAWPARRAAGGRHLLDLPAARARPDHPRRGAAAPAGRLRGRPRRRGRRGRPHAPRRLRPDLPAHDARHGGHGAARRGPAAPHAGHRAGARGRAQRRCATRAATASACRWTGRRAPLPIGTAEILRDGDDVCLLAVGTHGGARALAAARAAARAGLAAEVVDMRFVKPLDAALLADVWRRHRMVVTIEENTVCGGLRRGGARVGGRACRAPRRARAASAFRTGSRTRRRAPKLLAELGLDARRDRRAHPAASSRRAAPPRQARSAS